MSNVLGVSYFSSVGQINFYSCLEGQSPEEFRAQAISFRELIPPVSAEDANTAPIICVIGSDPQAVELNPNYMKWDGWYSNGSYNEVTSYRGPAESKEDFCARHDRVVAGMKRIFPPDASVVPGPGLDEVDLETSGTIRVESGV